MKKILLPVAIITAFLLAGCNFNLAGDIKPPADYVQPPVIPPAATAVVFPLVPPDPANGEVVYAQYCAECHGTLANGAGDNASSASASPAALSHPENLRNAVPQDWFTITKNGLGSMPGFAAKLDDRQIWDTVAYLLSLENSPEQMALGAEIFFAACSQCHGETGAGNGPAAADLTVPPADLTNQSLVSALSNSGMVAVVTSGIGEMPAFGSMLSEEEKLAVVTYARSLAFKAVAITPPVETEVVTATGQPAEDPHAALTPGASEEVNVPEKVSVTGSVIHETRTSGLAGLNVTLLYFDNMEQTGALDTVTDDSGAYRFTDVPMVAGRIFLASVDYNGQTFSSQPSTHPGTGDNSGSEEYTLPISIYDSTTDKSVVTADRLHILMDFSSPGMVAIMEMYLLSNHSATTLVASAPGEGVIEFYLPEGAENLSFEDSRLGERYLATSRGFADTTPVKPGEANQQVMFMFTLPYEKKADLVIPVSLPVETVNVMLQDGNIKVKSEQLVEENVGGEQSMGFRVFSGEGVAAGESVQVTISGNPDATGMGAPSSPAEEAKGKVNPALLGAGLLVLAVTGAGYYYLGRKGNTQQDNEKQSQSLTDRESVMDAIIALDNLHEQGKIKEKAYQERREELKEKLKGMP